MKYHILAFGAGFLLDQLFGDPYFLPHPIRGIGWLIAKTEKTLRAGNPQGNPTEREGAERRQGKLLVVIVLLFTGMLSALILFGAYAMHPGLGVDPSEVTASLSVGLSLDHILAITVSAVLGIIWEKFGAEYVFFLTAATQIT